jgi:hypothetical protein
MHVSVALESLLMLYHLLTNSMHIDTTYIVTALMQQHGTICRGS